MLILIISTNTCDMLLHFILLHSKQYCLSFLPLYPSAFYDHSVAIECNKQNNNELSHLKVGMLLYRKHETSKYWPYMSLILRLHISYNNNLITTLLISSQVFFPPRTMNMQRTARPCQYTN